MNGGPIHVKKDFGSGKDEPDDLYIRIPQIDSSFCSLFCFQRVL